MIKELFDKIGIKDDDYFLTGSRALSNDKYTYHLNESDYDYVVLITDRHHIINYLNRSKIKIEPSAYNGGFKFNYNSCRINIITAIDIEFKAWKEALIILQLLIKTDEIYAKTLLKKSSRYCIYEQLRALIKTIIYLPK